MDYARFRHQGYLIGSGTIESACKQIAAARLKCSGARWTLAGVIATAKARAAWLSKTWDTLKPLYFNLSLAPNNFECSQWGSPGIAVTLGWIWQSSPQKWHK